MVVGFVGLGDLERIGADGARAVAPHGDEVRPGGELGDDQEIGLRAAVIVRELDGPVLRGEHANHVRSTGRSDTHNAPLGNLKAEVVGVGRVLQFAGSGRRHRHGGRPRRAIAVVVRGACGIE